MNVLLDGKRAFADVIYVKDLGLGDYLHHLGGPNIIPGSFKRKAGGLE